MIWDWQKNYNRPTNRVKTPTRGMTMRAAMFMIKTLAVLTSLISASDLLAQQGERRCEYRDGAIVSAMWSCPRGTIDVTPITSRPLFGADQSGGGSIYQPLLDQMNRRADRLDEELQRNATARANQVQQQRLEEQAKEDRARQQERVDLENELLRLQIEALASGGNTAVANQSAAEPADLESIVQALSDSSSDAVITDAELSAIADRASSISSDFGQAFTVTRSFIVQSAAADTAPDVFANTQSQMRSVYGSLDRDQTLVMIDFVLREAVTATRMSNEVGSSSSNTRGQELITGLSSLNDLHERGLLNEEEFNAAKRRLLGL